MFAVALFEIVRPWKQPARASADEWINKRWYIKQWSSNHSSSDVSYTARKNDGRPLHTPQCERSQSARLFSVWLQPHDFLWKMEIVEAVKRSVVAGGGEGKWRKSRQNTEGFWVSESPLLRNLTLNIHRHLSVQCHGEGCSKCEPDVTYGLWVITVGHRRVIDCNHSIAWTQLGSSRADGTWERHKEFLCTFHVMWLKLFLKTGLFIFIKQRTFPPF